MSNIVKKEISYDQDKLTDIILEKEADEMAKFYSENAANELVAQVLNKMDIDHQEIQNGMYPELWKAMRKAAVKSMDLFTFLMEETITKDLYDILEKEKTNPIQKPEDRPEQDQESKEKGLLFTDKINVPKQLQQPSQPQIPDINIYEKFVDKDIDYIVKHAIEIIKQNPNWSITEEGEEEYTSNLINCKALDDAINSKTIDMNQFEELTNQITLCTDENFANIFVWEVFEMPEVIKDMINQYNESMNQLKARAASNSDATHVFINPEYKVDEMRTFEEARKLVCDHIEDAFGIIVSSFSDIETNLENTIKNSFGNITCYMTNNEDFLQCIIEQKISKDYMKDIIAEICDIIIASDENGIEKDIITSEEDNIRWCAFNVIHVFFPPTIAKEMVNTDNSEEETTK